jgi:hypothetical protein
MNSEIPIPKRAGDGTVVRHSDLGFLSSFGFRVSGLALLVLLASLTAAVTQTNRTVLLFSFFRGNGEDGLNLAWSTNGLQWSELTPPGKSFLEPKVGGKLMRDPCLALGPDGTFHMVWTTSWGRPAVIGCAHSQDLLHWSEQKAVPVMETKPEASNAWAPELFYDQAKSRWLVFWASTIPGRFPETAGTGDGDWNHRIYHTVTTDFTTYTPAKLFFDGGFDVIDATLLPANGKFYLVVKDETKNPVKKNLHLAVGDSPEGPFGKAGPAISGQWVEGPSAIQIGNEFYIYFDHYARPQYYGAVKSTDLEHWQDVSARLSFPQGARHGTVLQVPEAVIRNLQSLPDNTTKPKPQ